MNFNLENVLNSIISSPLNVDFITNKNLLFSRSYEPGTFTLAERSETPSFLFDESIPDYREWVYNCVNKESMLLRKIPEIEQKLDNYGKEKICEDIFNFLHIDVGSNKKLHDFIYNQNYVDSIRSILYYLLTGSTSIEYNIFHDFNTIGRKIALDILNDTSEYDLYHSLLQSISSGLIGINMKDENDASSPLCSNSIIPINKGSNCNLKNIKDKLNDKISKGLSISFWDDYEKEIIGSKDKITITWISDDYIPTIFEMKFIENQLDYNSNIKANFVPRSIRCGNDATYSDVNDILEEPVFEKLKMFLNSGRFYVCKQGPDIGSFNGERITNAFAKLLLESDYVVITGARSYESSQGLKKKTYYSGIAVCRQYTETVTGIDKNSGGLLLIRQPPGVRSFHGFRDRAWRRRISEHGNLIPVAKFTAIEYAEELKKI